MFYGQSISTPKWTDQAMVELRREYPNVAFDARNLALGGWTSTLLERAATRDLEDVYPDLVVFHAYGDHRAYERIIQTMRSETAADVIVQTDHVVTPVEPVCDTGFHLRWSPRPGCTGHFWFRQHIWEDFMSGVWLPTLAEKYDLALEPRRQRWNAYLESSHLKPKDLIADEPHPNERGWTLMANLFTSWFERLEEDGSESGRADSNQVRDLVSPKPGVSAHYEFDGNRIELFAAGSLSGKVRVTVDGKAPRDLDGCWQDTRVSRLPNVEAWPALKQVSVDPTYHEPDRWTVRVSHLNDAQDRFTFDLASKRGGPDGIGTGNQAFKSKSGLVTIQSRDWNLAYARQVAGHGVAEGTTFTWERRFVCDEQSPTSMADGSIEHRYILATGLENGHHTVELTLGSDVPAVSVVRTYRPPWKL
jgi:hypothetical protein